MSKNILETMYRLRFLLTYIDGIQLVPEVCYFHSWKWENVSKNTDAIDRRFSEKTGDGRVEAFVAKVLDDFIIAGFPSAIDRYLLPMAANFRYIKK